MIEGDEEHKEKQTHTSGTCIFRQLSQADLSMAGPTGTKPSVCFLECEENIGRERGKKPNLYYYYYRLITTWKMMVHRWLVSDSIHYFLSFFLNKK